MTPLDDPIIRTTFSTMCGVPAHTPTLTVRAGIAYIQTHELRKAIRQLAGTGPVVLVTHGSDAPATDELAALLHANVKAWFSMNSVTARARPLPIGLRSDSVVCPLLAQLRHEARHPRDDRPMRGRRPLYLCCTWNTPNLSEHVRVERRKLYDLFGDKPWATCEGGNSMGDVSFGRYCLQMRSHRYCLCPRGAGEDSHRIAESHYLGTIPIIRRSKWSQRFTEFDPPWLLVHDWSQVTPELLDREYPRLSSALAAWTAPLTATYWLDQIRGAK